MRDGKMREIRMLQIYEYRERLKRSCIHHGQLPALLGTQLSRVQITEGQSVHLQSPCSRVQNPPNFFEAQRSLKKSVERFSRKKLERRLSIILIFLNLLKWVLNAHILLLLVKQGVLTSF